MIDFPPWKSAFNGGDTNLYRYAFGDPINFRDPKSKNTIAVGGGIGAAVVGPPGAVVGAVIGATIGIVGYIVYNESQSDSEGDTGEDADRNPAQDKRLTPGEIKKLKDAGFDPEELKGGTDTGKYDLFKDKKGNICVKPRDGSGPGDFLDININDL